MRKREAVVTWLVAAGFLMAVTGGQAAARNPFSTIGLVSAGHDSNLRAAQSSDEKIEASFYSLLVSTNYRKQLSLNSALSGRLQLQTNYYDRFSKLSNGRAVSRVRLTQRVGRGFFSPTFSLWGSAARLAYGSEIRTGNEYRVGLTMTQNLTTRLRGRLELRGLERESKGEVFDLSSVGAGMRIEWKLGPKLSTSLGYEFQDGDSFSSAAPNIEIVRAAEAIEADDAFGGLAANQFAYRIQSHTHVGSFGMNYQLARDYALDVIVQSVNVDGALGHRYQRLLASVGLLVRF